MKLLSNFHFLLVLLSYSEEISSQIPFPFKLLRSESTKALMCEQHFNVVAGLNGANNITSYSTR